MRTLITTFFLVLSLTLLSGCAREYIGEDPPTNALHFPIGVAISATQRRALVVSSNFDLGYNRGVVHLLDLDRVEAALQAGASVDKPIEDALIAGVRTPSFGGPIAIAADGRRAFVANRELGHLLEVDLGADGSSLSCGDRGPAPQDCSDGDHMITLRAADPYDVEVAESATGDTRIFVSGLGDGLVDRVSAREIDGDARLTLTQSIDSELHRASGLALRPQVGTTAETLLIAGQFRAPGGDPRPNGAYLRLYDTSLSSGQQLGAVPLTSSALADDARDVVLAPDGLAAFVAQRNPSSVAKIDLAPGPDGLPSLRTVAVQSVGLKPVAMVVDADAAGGAQILIACFDDQTLYALDAATLAIRSVITGLQGSPAEMAVDASSGHLLLSLFDRDVVAVVALDRVEHPGLEVLAWIGVPRPIPVPSFTLDPYAWY